MAWDFWLADLGNTNVYLLNSARKKQLSCQLSRPGSLSFSVDMYDRLGNLEFDGNSFQSGAGSIKAYQDGVLRWGGPITSVVKNGDTRTIDVSAVGWFEYLNRRVVRDNDTDRNSGITLTNPGLESGTTTGWGAAFANTTLVVTSSSPHSGSFCLLGSLNAAGSAVTCNTSFTHSATPGETIYASVWVKSNGLNANVKIAIAQTNPLFAFLVDGPLIPCPVNVWTLITASCIVPPSSPTLAAYIYTDVGLGAGLSISFDDFQAGTEQNNFYQMNPTAIAQSLLTYADLRSPVPVSNGSISTNGSEVARTVRFRPFQNIGQEIIQLSNLENGFDIWIDPSTRVMNLYHQAVVGNVIGRGSNKTSSVLFGYGTRPDNVLSLRETTDPSWMVNWIAVQGKSTTQSTYQGATDSSSVSTYYAFDESVQLGEVSDVNVLTAYANAEIAIRSSPRKIYEFVPVMSTPTFPVFRPFIDYDLGDVVSLSARVGSISFANQAIRIYGFDLTFDEEGNEIVSSLQTSP